MKPINIDGTLYMYEVNYGWDEFIGGWIYTMFYLGTKTEEYRKWFLGRKLTRTVPKAIFSLDIDIEAPVYTKEEIRKYIDQKLALIKRKEEIEAGKII